MRLGAVVLVLVFAAVGAMFGALNAAHVDYDFYFFTFGLPKGAAVLVALMAGWIAGGLVVWTLRVPRLRRELAAARRQLRDLRAESSTRADAAGGDASGRA